MSQLPQNHQFIPIGNLLEEKDANGDLLTTYTKEGLQEQRVRILQQTEKELEKVDELLAFFENNNSTAS